MKTIALIAFIFFLAESLAAPLQPFQMRCTVRMYDQPVGEGKRIQLSTAEKDLSEIGFDDKASSLKITGPCSWIFYTESNFQGEASILGPGSHASLGSKDNTFSSLRPLPPQGTTAAVLFEDANFCGAMVVLTRKVNRLERMEFNDKTSSVIVTGGNWEFCQHAWVGMEGDIEELEPGTYPELPQELRQKISLVRLVDE